MAAALRWTVLLGLLVPGAVVAQRVAATRTASVTYLGRGWVFVDAGSTEGLREGSEVRIVRRGRTVAVLRVESVDVHQANCAVVSHQVNPMVGDSVRFTPVASPAGKLPVVAVRPPPPRAPPAESTVAATVTRPQIAPPRPDSTTTLRFVSPASVRAPLVEQPSVDAPASRQGGTATVTYMAGDWLFVDAGSAEGLRQGSEVEVMRRGRSIGVLRVESLVDHQANCAVVSRQLSLTVGDSVRFTPVEPPTRAPTVIAARPLAPVLVPPSPALPETAAARAVAAPRPAETTVAAARAPVNSAPPPPPPLAPQPLMVATTVRPGITTVTFVSGAEIYVGAGRREGVLEGAELYVVRRDSVVSTLRVKFLSSHQASCEVMQGASDIGVGDAVRFVPSMTPLGTGTMATADRPRRPRRLSGPGLHGRLGMRYLRAMSAVAADSSSVQTGRTAFNQPSFDLRLNGLSIGGTAMGLAVDLRTRRTATSSTGQANRVDGRTRVYQAAVFWGAPGAPVRTVAGRQYLAAVTSVGMFDGGLFEVNRSRLTMGVFGGLEPDAANLGFSRAIQDHGAYVQVHNRPGTPSSWFLTGGAVRSFEAGSANREFGFMQANATSRYFAFYGLQEVDYYPSWKVQLGEKQFSFTSQYASGLLRPSHWLSFNGTYDNRRSVRLYRDTQNPETSFDDAYRQGFGGGVQVTARKAYVGADWRRSTGGTAGAADSYTGTLGLDRFTRLKLGVSARATWYQNRNDSTLNNPGAMRTKGQLYSGRLGIDPVGPLHVDINGGIRRENNPISASVQQSTWFGVDVDASVARSWFVSFSGLRQQDPANPGTIATTQMYASVTWRF